MDNQKPPFPEEQLSRKQYREQLAQKRAAGQEEEGGEQTRQHYAQDQEGKSREEKTAVLKRKLNIAIVGLIVAIIIVYLVLFFVG
ncbi:hypothetical protein [Limosilactobacillus avium]|uniref:hypothetical protein n=1 Tax=Limosilactobacillus avium TaxID=2991831 RepID=UPI0024BA2CE9|nr:hypothetical protein [Limosilactobacillus avium]